MPAKDRYHDNLVHALIKDNWTITGQQYTIVLPERFLWIDIRAEKAAQNQAIFVELKGFEAVSQIEYLASAVGKYLLYQEALELLHNSDPLYMAVPIAAYQGILSETIGQRLINRLGMRLIAFNPKREEIVRWIEPKI
jgi:hypothetical protein